MLNSLIQNLKKRSYKGKDYCMINIIEKRDKKMIIIAIIAI
jgi:hypothetical protein